MEVTQDTQQGRHDGRRSPGLEDQFHAFVTVLEDRRIEDRGQREEGADAEIDEAAGDVRHLGQRKQATRLDGDKEHGQRSRATRHLQAEDEPEAEQERNHRIGRRRLADDEARHEDAKRQQHRSQEAEGGKPRVECPAIHGVKRGQ